MKRERDRRLRAMLEAIPSRALAAVARVAGVAVAPGGRKEQRIDGLAALPASSLEDALAGALAARDLQALCARFGYSGAGRKAELAARLMAALDASGLPRWRPFAAARSFARSLEVRSQTGWYQIVQLGRPGRGPLPVDVPKSPNLVYAGKGWTSWGDFLGTDNPARQRVRYRPFAEARAYARGLGLANRAEWDEHTRRRIGNRRVLPADIPAAPHHVYAGKGWVSLGDWLGTGHVHSSKIRYRTYRATRAFVRGLGIRNIAAWRAYCRREILQGTPRPLDVPSNPQRTYRGKGWTTWGELFGTNAVAHSKKKFRSYRAASAYVRDHGPKDAKRWRAWCASGARPPDIPASPDQLYRGRGWVSWGHFLGTGSISNAERRRSFRSFREARSYARALGLADHGAWRAWSTAGKRPEDVPAAPNVVYRGRGWVSWGDFLGTGNVRGGARDGGEGLHIRPHLVADRGQAMAVGRRITREHAATLKKLAK